MKRSSIRVVGWSHVAFLVYVLVSVIVVTGWIVSWCWGWIMALVF